MDALRKAEESKKQAEQEKKETSTGDVFAPTVESSFVNPASKNISSDPDPGATVAASGSNPVEPLQAKSEVRETTETAKEKDELEASAKPAESLSSFELEPRLETSVRTPSYMEVQLQTSVQVDDDQQKIAQPLATVVDDADSISSFLSSTKLEQAVSQASAELAKKKPTETFEPADEGFAAVHTTGEKVGSNDQAGIGTKDFAVNPQTKSERTTESIADRTAVSRKSAESVFAAKKISQNNGRTKIIGAAGVALALMLGIGFYFTVSLAPSNGILVSTENFPVNRPIENVSDTEMANEDLDSQVLAETATTIDSDVNQLQSDLSLDLNAVESGAGVTVFSESALGLEAITLFESGDFAPVEQAQINSAASTDAVSSNRALSVVVDAPVENDSVPINAPPMTAVSSAVSSVSDSANSSADDGSNSSSQDEIGATFNGVSDTAAVSAPAVRELVSFRRTNPEQAIAPALTEGFRAYQNGNLDLARDLYEQTLADTPENIDALLGLAAIAGGSEEISLAMGLYSRALSLDPSNAIAKTAIRSLAPLGSAAEQERELRRLDSQNPNVAPLAFVLGNFYASQSRWNDAQRFYFKALQLAKSDAQTGSSISPDYAFNLAVSLERLNQARPALNFYEEALALATRFPANFDLSIARARLESLSRTNSQ